MENPNSPNQNTNPAAEALGNGVPTTQAETPNTTPVVPTPTETNPAPNSARTAGSGATTPATMPASTPQSGGISMLDQIIASSKQTQPVTPGQTPTTNTDTPIPPKQKQRMSVGTILRLIGTLFLVILIFLGMFLSYIVFHPDEAGFFVSVFNISPNDVANVLSVLINASFGILSFLISIVFIVSLFRAFWIPKEQKRKKLLTGLIATFAGIIFFMLLGFWAFLYQQLLAANFSNPNGNILIYDNDMFTNDSMKSDSEIDDLNNLIWPITLRYNISDNAKTLAKKNGIKIDRYEIDFDGAKCSTGESKVSGVDPQNETDIICIFDELKNYNPKGYYVVTNYTGNQEQVQIDLPQVQIRGLMKISEQENKDGKLIRTYDASALRHLGTPVWFYDNSKDKEIRENYIALTPTAQPTILHFYLDNNGKKVIYYRSFIVQTADAKTRDGEIEMTQNTADPQEYIFKLSNITQNQDEILAIDWKLDKTNICTDDKGFSCSYRFVNYGQFRLEATIKMIGDRTKQVATTIQINTPLKLERHVKVTNKEWKLLNSEDTYDARRRMFIVKDISWPDKIFLDARDVIPDNTGYHLKSVNWKINDNSNSIERTGERIEFDIVKMARYEVIATYEFEKNIKSGRNDDIRTVQEGILFDLERKNLYATLNLDVSSDYVPAKVIADASQSHSEYSEIIKFIYDFGEGKPKAEGDAVQTYQYTSPGQKTITVTIIDANGEQATTQKTIVLKDTPKNLDFTTSLSPGIINMPVDFIAKGTTGEVEDYLWNFSDNTPVNHGYEVSHTFQKPGSYKVYLTVRYTDGTERTITKNFIVTDSLE